jgi:type I restriction enzyme S subunit
VKHGFAFKSEFFVNCGEHVVVTPGNFFDEGGFKSKGDNEKFYDGPVPDGYVLAPGSLIVAMTEQAEGLLGSAAKIPEGRIYLHNQRLGLVSAQRSDRLDLNFAYHLFNSKLVRQQIRASASGTKVRHTSPARIGEVRVKLPPLSMQTRIADILSAYDDLIENNARRIAILEDMARRLFEEWFVQLRRPGGGPSPQFRTATIAETFETVGGGTPSKAEPSYWDNGTINWYTPTDLTRSGSVFLNRSRDRISDPGLRKSGAQLFPARSIMMTSRATLGVFAINTSEATTNQGFITSLPNDDVPLFWLFHWLKANSVRFEAIASGATFKEVTKGNFRKLEIDVPDRESAHAFEALVAPGMEIILTLQRQSANLRTARDFLLPKLISGEVEVGAAEEALEAVAA